MTIAAGAPAEVAQNAHNRATVEGSDGSGVNSSGHLSGSNAPQVTKRSTGGKSVASGSSSGGTAVPEPSNVLMLALGLVGLIAGRMVALRRKKT